MSLQGRRNIPVPSFAPPSTTTTSNDCTKKTATIKANAETNNDDDDGVAVTTENEEVIIIPESRQLIRLPVNTQCMIHLDNALQLYRHQQKQQGLPDSDRISFANFSKISSKVEAKGSAAAADDDNDDDRAAVDAASTADVGESESQNTKIRKNPVEEDLVPELWNLSKEERFWHDLYCVAVPVLYSVNDSAAHSNGGQKNETTDSNSTSPQRKKKRRRRLAAIPLELTLHLETGAESSKSNRVKELRRLVREAGTLGVPKAKSEKALCLLQALRQENEKELDRKTIIAANAASSSSNNNNSDHKSTADSLLRDSGPSSAAATANDNSIAGTTTIDDRIRAKAKERERNLEQARAARKDPREERVAIADALYSYACHVLRRRQSRSQNKSRRFSGRSSSVNANASSNANAIAKVPPSRTTTIASSTTKCILTFKEVVESGLPNRSRKEIARIMWNIVEVLSSVSTSLSTSSVAPSTKFLKWKDFKTGEAYGIPISKNATVTIDTTDFKKVREILNRERFLNNATTVD